MILPALRFLNIKENTMLYLLYILFLKKTTLSLFIIEFEFIANEVKDRIVDLPEKNASLAHPPSTGHLRRQHLNVKIPKMDPQTVEIEIYI